MHLKKLACLSMALLPFAAHAEIYICKDASGRTLTSDRPIMECQDRKVRVMNSSGTTRELAAPLTAEEKRQKQAEDDQKRGDVEASKEQRRQDRALLARYKSESDIETDRKRTLDGVKDQLRRAETGVAESEKRQKEVLDQTEVQKKAKKPVTPALQGQLDLAEQSVADSRKQLADRQAEIAQINAKFDNTLKRYRELNGSVAPSASAPVTVSAASSSAVASAASRK